MELWRCWIMAFQMRTLPSLGQSSTLHASVHGTLSPVCAISFCGSLVKNFCLPHFFFWPHFWRLTHTLCLCDFCYSRRLWSKMDGFQLYFKKNRLLFFLQMPVELRYQVRGLWEILALGFFFFFAWNFQVGLPPCWLVLYDWLEGSKLGKPISHSGGGVQYHRALPTPTPSSF